MPQPNVLLIITDQQRYDTIAALGNGLIRTPNYDRLVRRGVSFTNAYTDCPVCVPARYVIRSGCKPYHTGYYTNGDFHIPEGAPEGMEERCGPYLARTMRDLGYRTFGIGKFHTQPMYEDLGYEVHLHTEELWGNTELRARDAYVSFIAREHPEYAHVEQIHGERTEMYYMPQTSPLPAELTVEAFVADRAIEQISADNPRPWFGTISFIGPHPPFAPPVPYNRIYDPDCMPNPVRGDLALDHMDEQIPWMNHAIWADDISSARARALVARYYEEIAYIDDCLGRILNAVEARDDAENTLICMVADHGEMLGDHHAWQKECYFEGACHVPFFASWPAQLPGDVRREELVALCDLFGLITSAAGKPELRDGIDLLGMLKGRATPREALASHYGAPGSRQFKIMIRHEDWKYVYMANGGREQLFNLADDPHELHQRIGDRPDAASTMRELALESMRDPGLAPALENGRLRAPPFEARPFIRIRQFASSRGIRDFQVTCLAKQGGA